MISVFFASSTHFRVNGIKLLIFDAEHFVFVPQQRLQEQKNAAKTIILQRI